MANNRYADDIRRIVGVDDVGNPLDEAQQKDRIDSKKSVAYYDVTGAVQSSNDRTESGTNGANTPNGEGTNNTPGSQYGGTGGGGTSSSQKDPFDPLSWLYPEDANNDVGGASGFLPTDNISSVSGVDPTTGKDVELFIGETFLGDIGEGLWPPPVVGEGVDDTWQTGFYWVSVWAFATPQSSPQKAGEEVANGLGGELLSVEPFGMDDPPISYTANVRKPNGTEQGFGINRFVCTGGDPSGDGDYCSLSPPDGVAQELDKIMARINNEGKIETNSNQNPNDLAGFTGEGFEGITLESKDNPGEFFNVEQATDGSTLIYQVDAGDPSTAIGLSYTKVSPTGVSEVKSIDTLAAYQK